MPAQNLIKTEAGRAEIRSRSLPLSRAARNLLLIVDASHDSAHWVALVQGCTEADLQVLLTAALVEPAPTRAGSARQRAAPSGAPSPAPAAAAPAAPGEQAATTLASAPGPLPVIPLTQALARLPFRTLYDRLTAEARPRLGLINGYRTILTIERAPDIDALRAVAMKFVEQVRAAHGDEVAQEVAQYLADGKPKR